MQKGVDKIIEQEQGCLRDLDNAIAITICTVVNEMGIGKAHNTYN